MPSSLALILTVGFIFFLYWRDIREQPNVTRALWIPTLWMMIIGSRFVSEWVTLNSAPSSITEMEDGSPLDRVVFLSLIVGGLYILIKRKTSFSKIFQNNICITIYIIYCGLSLLWSDFPFVAFKRWIKILGHPIMVLILLTEPDPHEAVSRLMKRCAYILIPISVLFIKYYPELGRGFDSWTGAAVNLGITRDKNALGYICMVLGFYFFWNFLRVLANDCPHCSSRWQELFLSLGFLAMIGWLLSWANSVTSLVSLTLGLGTLLLLGLPFISKKYLGIYFLVGLASMMGAEALFGLSDEIITSLGRDPTLTDRTKVWQTVLEFEINPFIGAGFESFWLGERLEKIWSLYWWRPNQAHNGYLEIYLNLGYLGLFSLTGLIVSTFQKGRKELFRDSQFGKFRLGILMMIILYNYAESSFKAVHFVFFVFFVIAMDYPLNTRNAIIIEKTAPAILD
jgi:exopolysaccharide production protein ExoQ